MFDCVRSLPSKGGGKGSGACCKGGKRGGGGMGQCTLTYLLVVKDELDKPHLNIL